MTFDHPQGLWLLALGVPILAFHFYRGRLRKMPVPTLLFWEQVLVEEERRTALRRLRHWASLLLNLAALFALTSAVAGPEVPGVTRPRGRYAVVIDNGPRMGAIEADGRTRLAAAVDRAREFIRSLGHGDRVAVHDLSGMRAPFTADLGDAAARISAPGAAPRGDLRDRVRAAQAAGGDVTVVLITDAPPAGLDDLLAAGRLRVARVGAPAANSGWVAGVPVRRAGEKSVTLALAAASFADRPVEREAVLHFNGKEIAREKVALEPGARREIEWVLHPSKYPGERIEEGGLARVVLEPPDGFPADDQASFVVPPLLPPAVIVFHPGSPGELLMPALEALRAYGIVHQDILHAPVERFGAMRGKLGEGWVVIFDRVAPPAFPDRGGILILGAPGGKVVERPTISGWDREAPPNRLVDYGGLLLRRSRILAGDPLIQAVEGPVAAWSARGGRAVVETGFAFEDADQRPPILMMLFNAIEWMAWRGTRAFRTEYRAGEPIRPDRPVWLDDGELLFEHASGRADRAEVRRGWPRAAPAAEPGFVRIGAAGRAEWTAVNLFDPEESDLRERPEPAAVPGLPPPAPWHARIPYAVLAAAAVLALLLVEWWLFHRGWI
jgi:hypothetical protein